MPDCAVGANPLYGLRRQPGRSRPPGPISRPHVLKDGPYGWRIEWRRVSDNARHREDGPAVKHANGSEEWWQDDEKHREDGPAIQDPDGYEAWYLRGERHRQDGPAVEDAGERHWYLHGKRHREDGPAVEYSDGKTEWWLEDEQLTEQGWRQKIGR